jgi:hypothetical protein
MSGSRNTSEKYIIAKVPIDDKKTPMCAFKAKQENDFIYEDVALKYGCYDIHAFGAPDHPNLSASCLEEWKKVNAKWLLQSVSCHDENYIQFKPDGAFIAADWYAPHDLDDNADQKDSKVIAVGRCAVM